MDRSLVKEYINKYIQDIVMYNPSDLWILGIIHFVDGSERWGTIKETIPSKDFDSLLSDSETIIEQALVIAYRMVNILLVKLAMNLKQKQGIKGWTLIR